MAQAVKTVAAIPGIIRGAGGRAGAPWVDEFGRFVAGGS